jgi:hypothetical protein
MTASILERAIGPVRTGLMRSFLFASLCGFALLGATTGARADEQLIDANPGAIVRINVREGDVTIRTWNRPQIAIDGDPSLSVEKRSNSAPLAAPIPIPQMEQDTPNGSAALPLETFVAAPIPEGPHDVVIVKSGPTTPRGSVTVTIPSDTAFVFARAANGKLDVSDYRGGTLAAFTRNGRLSLTNVGGTVFAQTFRGPLVVRGSSFDRIRARSLFGNVSFEHCDARQIETTTVDGSIVYDGGSFAPGLARFESTNGNVAIGASGNVQYGAHAVGDGHVYTNFNGRSRVDERGPDTNAFVGEGGPLVTATTQGGNVYLYDGSLRSRTGLPPEWQPAYATLERPGERSEEIQPRPDLGPPRYVAPRYVAPHFDAQPRFGIQPPNQAPRYVAPHFPAPSYIGPRRYYAPRRFTPPPHPYRNFRRR